MLPAPETSREGAGGINTWTSLSQLFPIAYSDSYHWLNLKEVREFRSLVYNPSNSASGEESRVTVDPGAHEDFSGTE